MRVLLHIELAIEGICHAVERDFRATKEVLPQLSPLYPHHFTGSLFFAPHASSWLARFRRIHLQHLFGLWPTRPSQYLPALLPAAGPQNRWRSLRLGQGYNIGWNQLKEFTPDLNAYLRRHSKRYKANQLHDGRSPLN